MSVVSFQDLPLADEGMAWDKGAQHKAAITWVGGDPNEWAAADWAKFRSLHLWYDSANGQNLTAYKFQVAGIVGGAAKYVFRAVSASLAVLRGARGGGSGSDWWSDRAAMESHVKKIYAKFGKDFPAKTFEAGPERKDVRFEIKTLDESGRFTGLAATYGNVDQGGDMIVQGAFTKTLQERNGKPVPILWSHNPTEPVGLGDLADSPEGLMVDGQLELSLPESQKTYIRMKKNLARGLSIGFETVKSEFKDGIRLLKELRLFEVSLCVFPMNEQAVVLDVKARKDFTAELQAQQLCAARWQMIQALCLALDDVIEEADPAVPADAIAAAQETIQQFEAEYTAWLPQMLALQQADAAQMNGYMARLETERKEGRRISSATAEAIKQSMKMHRDAVAMHQKALTISQALLDDEAAGYGTTLDGAAGKVLPAEPGVAHSLDVAFWTDWKARV